MKTSILQTNDISYKKQCNWVQYFSQWGFDPKSVGERCFLLLQRLHLFLFIKSTIEFNSWIFMSVQNSWQSDWSIGG